MEDQATTGEEFRNNEARLNDLGPAESEHRAKVQGNIEVAKSGLAEVISWNRQGMSPDDL